MNNFPCIFVLLILLRNVQPQGATSPTAACEAALPTYLSDLQAGRKPLPLPIPSTEFLPQVRPVGYNLKKLRRSVHTIHEGAYYAMLLYRGDSMILIDSPEGGSFAKRDNKSVVVGSIVTDAILEVLNGSIPKSFEIIYSHSHFDHIGTATIVVNFIKSQFPRTKIRIWASEGTLRTLKQSTSGRAPLPTNILPKQAVVLQFGSYNDPIRLKTKVVGGHTEDDLLIYIMRGGAEEPGIVFFVDVIFPGWAPFRSFAVTQDLQQYIQVHNEILSLDFGVFIGGHLTRTGTKEDIVKNKLFTKFVIEATRASFKVIPTFSEVAQTEGVFDPQSRNFSNVWLAFEKQSNALTKDCEIRIVKEWGCKLAGVDQQAPSKCLSGRDFLDLDE